MKVLSLDPGCISHTGNNQHLMTLFKTACLRYKPNPVEYMGKWYERNELINLQVGLQFICHK
jgi:hypothetical protein